MCTHQKIIYSPYLRYPIYVKCGKCKSCLQEKANARARRIRATEKEGYVCIMASLTYSRFNAPYILRDEAYEFVNGRLPSLNVYRDVSYRKVRKPKDGDDYFQSYKVTRGKHVVDTVEFCESSTLSGTKDLKHEFGRIGVCCYADYQQFIARFRLNLLRHFGYENKLFIFACSEYGAKSFRPHFHVLLFCPATDKEVIISTIYESWPFSNLRKFPRAVEVAFRASSYVASYVNSGSRFPRLFKSYFCQKHSYSKGFGTNYRKFSLHSLLEMFNRGNFRYSVLKNIQGVDSVINVPVPAYVISRYFPKFKGYTRIPPSSLVTYMHGFAEYKNPYEWEYGLENSLPWPKTKIHPDMRDNFAPLYWSDDEVHKIGVCLNNAYQRFCYYYPDKDNVPSLNEYFFIHTKVWRVYHSTLLRLQMEDSSVPIEQHFDNLDSYLNVQDEHELKQGVDFLLSVGLNPTLINSTDPNTFSSVVRTTAEHSAWFDEHIKHRNVSNAIYLTDDSCEL